MALEAYLSLGSQQVNIQSQFGPADPQLQIHIDNQNFQRACGVALISQAWKTECRNCCAVAQVVVDFFLISEFS